MDRDDVDGNSAFGGSDDELPVSVSGDDAEGAGAGDPELGGFLSSWVDDLDVAERASRRRRARTHTAHELRCGQLFAIVIEYLGELEPDGGTRAMLGAALAATSSIITDAAQHALFRHLHVSTRTMLPRIAYALRAQPALVDALISVRIDMGAGPSRVLLTVDGETRRGPTRAEIIRIIKDEFETRDRGWNEREVVGLQAPDQTALMSMMRGARRLTLEHGAALAADAILDPFGAMPDLTHLCISLDQHYRQCSRFEERFRPFQAQAHAWPGASFDALRFVRLERIEVVDLGPFIRAPNLQTLVFDRCSLPTSSPPMQLPAASQLHDLRFNACSNVPVTDAVALLQQLGPQMVRFELERTTFDAAGARLGLVVPNDVHGALLGCASLERLVWVELDAAPPRAVDLTPILANLAPTLRSVVLAPTVGADFDPWLVFVGAPDRPLVDVTLHRMPNVRRHSLYWTEVAQFIWWASSLDDASGESIAKSKDDPSTLRNRVENPSTMTAWTVEQIQQLDRTAETTGRRLVKLAGNTMQRIVA